MLVFVTEALGISCTVETIRSLVKLEIVWGDRQLNDFSLFVGKNSSVTCVYTIGLVPSLTLPSPIRPPRI